VFYVLFLFFFIFFLPFQDDIFHSNIDFSTKCYYDGSALFLKYWSSTHTELDTLSYIAAPLPGLMEGVSGSSISGYNIVINKFVNEDKLEAAIMALKFFTSKEIQKKYFISGLMIPAIPSIYEDDEVCAVENCDLFPRMQFISGPVIKNENFIEYYLQYIGYMNNYFYGNEDVKDVLEKIDNIRKIHYISMMSDVNYSLIGLFFFIIDICLLFFLMLSLLLLFIKKFKEAFKFLPNDSWIISIFGLIILLGICFARYGPVTQFKCNCIFISLLFGYTLNMVPILHKLIVIFPEENKYSLWIKDHKYIFLLFFILSDSLLSILQFIFGKNNVKRVKIKDGENFDKCVMDHSFGLFFSVMLSINFIMIIISLLLFIFIEWNQRNYIKDLRLIVSTLYIDFLLILLQISVNVKIINSYKSHFLINETIVTIMVITHFILIYGLRIILKDKKRSYEESMNSCIKGALKMNEDYQSSLKNKKSLHKKKRNSLFSKILKYHYSNSSSSLGPSSTVPQFTILSSTEISSTIPTSKIESSTESSLINSNNTKDISNIKTENS